MIVNIRATSGAGKSTIAREIMARYPPRPLKRNGKVVGYEVALPSGPLFIVGRYETPCGGCDGIKTQDEVCARVRKYAKRGHVLFEGLIVTTIFERYAELLPRLGAYRFAFLNTPLRTCLRRVEKRRKARGNFKPLNPANTEAKYTVAKRTLMKCRERGLSHVVLDWRNATEEVLCLFK